MRPLASASETFFALALWNGALALCALSFALLGVVLVRRVLRTKREVRDAERRKVLSRVFYGALYASLPVIKESLPVLQSHDKPIAASIAADILRTTRGQEMKRVVEILRCWGMTAYLHKVAASGTRGKRIVALTLLSYFPDDASRDVLLRYAESPDLYVQLAALRGMAADGNKNIDAIVQSLSNSGAANAIMLADVLEKLGTNAVPSLIELASSDATEQVRLACLKTLAAIGSLEALPVCLTACKDPSPQMRAEAANSLGAFGDLRATETVLGLLSDDNQDVRAAAARALGNLQKPSVISPLLHHLDDDSWWVRFFSADSLLRFGDSGIAMLQLASSGQGRASEIATQVLKEHKVA